MQFLSGLFNPCAVLVNTKKIVEVLTLPPQPVGHLTLKSAHIAGNLINHFLKSQMPGGLPGGGGG